MSLSIVDIVNNLQDDERVAWVEGSVSHIVTTSGRVYSNLSRAGSGNEWHELSHRLTKTGYHRVQVTIDGKRVDKYVHRLVLETFSPKDGMEMLDCAHIDDNKNNNTLSNLMWMTRFDNNHWNNKIERGASKRRVPVYQYDLEGNFIARYDGLRMAERQSGNCRSNIARCAKGIYKQNNGYLWSFTPLQQPTHITKEEFTDD